MALSPLQREYRKFFRSTLKELSEDGMTGLSQEDIADFFRSIPKQWKKYKRDKDITASVVDKVVAKIYK